MGKKNETLTDFDKQLVAGMNEVVAHIKGDATKPALRSLSLLMRNRSERDLA